MFSCPVCYNSPVPCSSILVRVLPAAQYANGQSKTSREIPEDEWVSEGIYVPMPSYTEGVYLTSSSAPIIPLTFCIRLGLLERFHNNI